MQKKKKKHKHFIQYMVWHPSCCSQMLKSEANDTLSVKSQQRNEEMVVVMTSGTNSLFSLTLPHTFMAVKYIMLLSLNNTLNSKTKRKGDLYLHINNEFQSHTFLKGRKVYLNLIILLLKGRQYFLCLTKIQNVLAI